MIRTQNQLWEFSILSPDVSRKSEPMALDDLAVCVSLTDLSCVCKLDGTEVSLKTLLCPLLLVAEGGGLIWRCFEGGVPPFGRE